MNSAVYVSDGKKNRGLELPTADILPFYSFNQSSDTKNICTYELLVCKFYSLDFSRGFDMAVSMRNLFTNSSGWEVAKRLQGFVMWKPHENDGSRKVKRLKRSFVSDWKRPLTLSASFCRLISHMIGGHTIGIWKSSQSVNLLTFIVNIYQNFLDPRLYLR